MDSPSRPMPSISRAASRRWKVAGLGLLLMAAVGLTAAAQLKREAKGSVAGFRVVAEYPHDATAFTQGLAFADGRLYEGTGKKGESSLRQIELASGRIEQLTPLDGSLFGEGIAILDGRVYQLTWQNRLGIIYDQRTFNPISTFRYSGEGWGLTHDGKHLILSDGTSTLRFLDPQTFQVVKRLVVRAANGPIDKLNELEYVKGEILANIWYSDRIARISPDKGEVLGWIDLTNLYPARQRSSKEDVLNGIAYDEANDRLFVTGKNWPKVYEIEVVPKR
jgi:glutaminyl-peptide cyclotransferase